MSTASICILISIFVYLGITIFIGVYYSRKGSASDTENFYLGGRELHPLVTAMSAEASDMSSYLLMGLPGLAYLAGVAEVGWTVLGLAVGTYLNFLFVAKRLRIYSANIGARTIPAFPGLYKPLPRFYGLRVQPPVPWSAPECPGRSGKADKTARKFRLRSDP